jgi:hypothetical protein
VLSVCGDGSKDLEREPAHAIVMSAHARRNGAYQRRAIGREEGG